ncbi:MAG: HNH endonuclease [Selenomonadaceae bacterium]|nr:HNH endonuclease [Selenomonadaceae bacterium]
MKNPERVAELLAELRELAENDFERHRISVLERDLTNPPQVEVIDDTHQRFNGVTFTKRKNDPHYVNFYSMHRAVYAYCSSEIPAGSYEVHHRDFNAANNAPENLQLLTKAEHNALHGIAVSKPLVEKICPICKKVFYAKRDTQIYCSRDCTRKIPRNRNKKPPVQKICTVCGKLFTASSKNPSQITCSRKCGDISAAEKKRNIWATGFYGTRTRNKN